MGSTRNPKGSGSLSFGIEIYRMKPSILTDYHLHTAVTIDGRMTETEACDRALAMGISEIAFTNHFMLTQPEYTITPTALVDHWNKIKICREQFPMLAIRIGIEMDYYPGREIEIEANLNRYAQIVGGSFDLVLGSVHDVNGVFFSNKHLAPAFFTDHELLALYKDYFHLAAQAARSRLFDVIAHPDLIKKYTNQLTPFVPYEEYHIAAERFIDALVESEVGLEVNTKGLKLPLNEIYPSKQLLLAYLAKISQIGTEPIVSLGSDAHSVEGIGFRIKETVEDLRNLGLPALTQFDQRSKTPIRL
jgi:histidinol-phosphatase (PHP family)